LRQRSALPPALLAVISLALAGFFLASGSAFNRADAAPLALCGNPGPAPAIKHVLVVMLENQSKNQIIGNSSKAPFMNGTMAAKCPTAANMFGATHWSAANYLAITAGKYPPNSPAGCPTVSACVSTADNLFNQMQTAGLSWRAYEESMPTPCNKSTQSGYYKLGHNPAPFYTNLNATCAQYDVPVPDLTVQSGVFWNDLQNRTLPSFAFISPNTVHDGQDGGTAGIPAIDSFLSQFVPLVEQSASYQAGDTVLMVTFDEGAGPDAVKGQNCLDKTRDLAGQQESCHIPFFVLYPYANPGAVPGFFTHYSVTRTVEELFGLPLLAGAQTATSLVGPFLNTVAPTPSPTPSPSPSATATPTPPPGPTEYVVNKGFEGGAKTGWTGLYTGSSVSAVSTEAAYQGTYSLKVWSSATTAKSVGVTSKPPVITSSVTGTKLTGSVWVKASAAGQKLNQVVWEVAPGGTVLGSQTKTVTLGDTAWHQIKATTPYNVHQGGSTINMSVYATNLPVGQWFYADAFSLTSP
jgi:hypothetical protein